MNKKSGFLLMILVSIMGLLSACNAGQAQSPMASPTVEAQVLPTILLETPTATLGDLTRPATAVYLLSYDPESKQIIMIGYLNSILDVWAYDAASQKLTRLQDKPVFSAQCMDYNPTAKGVIVFSKISGATWKFDPATNEWKELARGFGESDNAQPPWLCFFNYDSESDLMVNVSTTATMVNNFDFASNTWTMKKPNPAPTMGAGPMVYDSESDRILMWDAVGEKQMWGYDANTDTWEKVVYTGGPPTGSSAVGTGVYVPDLDRTFFYYLDQFYAYDYNTNTWEQAKGELKPGSRTLASMAYDRAAKKIVMYGGMDENATMTFNDLWLYDPQTGEWAKQPIP